MRVINYNYNIDVLRGISILLVLIYHFKIELFNFFFFSGGYLGVDIFFLISGYLITSILHINIEKNIFSFKDFFLRRFLRIVPVYVFVIFLTLLASYFVLTPSHLIDISESSIASSFFYSNIFFWKTLNNYYNPDAILNPLLHTWSLSIEIQFYLFFSICFYILKKYFLRIKTILLTLGIISFTISCLFSYYEPQINFFGFQSRLWEFILGSFIFFYKDKINLQLNDIIKYLIYILVIIFAVFFDETTKHPSYLTLVFLFFVSILMLNCKNNKILTLEKPLKFFGTLSYSLYLWHYPILSIYERMPVLDTIYNKLILFIFIMIVSYFSYYFLELKLKKKIKINFYFVTIFFISLIILSVTNIKEDGFKNRLKLNKIYEDSQNDLSMEYLKGEKKIFENNTKKNILIIGNSHGVQSLQGFLLNKDQYNDLIFKNFHIQISCLGEFILVSKSDSCKGFLDFNEKENFLIGIENFKKAKTIILSTRWTIDDLKNLPSVIKFLEKQKKNIIIFNSIVDIQNEGDLIYKKSSNLNLLQKIYINDKFLFEKFLFTFNRFPSTKELTLMESEYFKNLSQKRVTINNKLKNLALENNITFFDLNSFICDNELKTCKVITNTKKHIMYDNTGHLTMNGAKHIFNNINNDFMSLLKNIK